jgi:haloalkane dehalogenase
MNESASLQVDAGDARLSYHRTGSGPPLLLIHGWPLSSATWRPALPMLERHFTCYAVDLAGAGESGWDERTDFGFEAQARRLEIFLRALGIERCDLLAHDTGATIGRRLALVAPGRVRRMVLINTEVPFHRPPWIRLFQATARAPGASLSFSVLLRSRSFRRSGMGFGGCFQDPRLLDGDFHDRIVAPLLASRRRIEGLLRYLRGIDWEMVDRMAVDHARITQPVLLLWGADDPTFPLAEGERLARQLPDCELIPVPGARLLVHEEKPEIVAERTIEFFGRE